MQMETQHTYQKSTSLFESRDWSHAQPRCSVEGSLAHSGYMRHTEYL